MINLAETLYIYATTRFDEALAKLEPPAFAVIDENTPEDVVTLLKTAGNSAARQYDKYKELFQLSCMHGNEVLHLALVDDENVGTFNVMVEHSSRKSTLKQVATEGELVAAFWDWFTDKQPVVVAGWRTSQLWAMLVNKALKYKIPVPSEWRQSPMKKWSTVDRLLDISNLYLQGVTPAVRLMPDLQDVLDYWEVAVPNRHIFQYPTQKELRAAKDSDWGHLVAQLEMYLDGMEQVLLDYTSEPSAIGGMNGESGMPGVPGVAGFGLRGPQPASG